MVRRTRTGRWIGAALTGLVLATHGGAQDCMESFDLPDDPVVITDIGIELEDMFAVLRDGEDNPDDIEAPTIAFAWRAYDRSARIRPRPSLGRMRLFVTPAPPPDADEDFEPETQSGCESFEIDFEGAGGVRRGMQAFPLQNLPTDWNVPPPGDYRVQIELAHQNEDGLVRERNLGNNIANLELPYYSEVAVTEAEATGSGLRLKLVNGGHRQTEELTVKVFSGGGAPVEETVEAIPGLPFTDQPPEDFTENEREVQVSVTNAASRITYVIEEVPTGRQVGSGSAPVDGGGSTPGGGTTPGGGGSMPGGGGGNSNGGTPPAPPTSTEPAEYEVEAIHVLPGDARDGIYTIIATIKNNGQPTTDRAQLDFQLRGARSRQSQSSQGNARIVDAMETIGPVPTRASAPAMAILDLSAETDPSRRADEVDIQVTVNLSGDPKSDNNSRTATNRIPGAVDQAARPPDWERGSLRKYYGPPQFAFGPGRVSILAEARNHGGPATSVSGELVIDSSEFEREQSQGLMLEAITGQGAPAGAFARWKVWPAFYKPPQSGGDSPLFKLSVPVDSTYRGANGSEETADQQEVVWEDIPFPFNYPGLDLIAKLTEPGGDDAIEGTVTLNVDEAKELELVITNNCEVRIHAGTGYKVEVTEEPGGIVSQKPEESGQFEDLAVGAPQRIAPTFQMQAGCSEYNAAGGGMGGMSGGAGGLMSGAGGLMSGGGMTSALGGASSMLGSGGGMSMPGTGGTGGMSVPGLGGGGMSGGGMSGGGMSGGGMSGAAVSLGTLEVVVSFDRDGLENVPDYLDDHDAENSKVTLQIELADPNGTCSQDDAAGGLMSGNPIGMANTGLGLVNSGLEAAGIESTGNDTLDAFLDGGVGGGTEQLLTEELGVDENIAGAVGSGLNGDTQGVVDNASNAAGVDIPELPSAP